MVGIDQERWLMRGCEGVMVRGGVDESVLIDILMRRCIDERVRW